MKTLDDIQVEFEITGRLSKSSIEKLKQLILSDDPYSAITVATDCGTFALAPVIAQATNSEDSMVRWNAIGALLTRFRLPEYADLGFEFALTEPDEMVRNIALVGLGEVLPDVKDNSLANAIAHYLIKVFQNEEEDILARGAAYDGILAALDVLPTSRPPANRPLDLIKDVDNEKIADFKKRYLF